MVVRIESNPSLGAYTSSGRLISLGEAYLTKLPSAFDVTSNPDESLSKYKLSIKLNGRIVEYKDGSNEGGSISWKAKSDTVFINEKM